MRIDTEFYPRYPRNNYLEDLIKQKDEVKRYVKEPLAPDLLDIVYEYAYFK